MQCALTSRLYLAVLFGYMDAGLQNHFQGCPNTEICSLYREFQQAHLELWKMIGSLSLSTHPSSGGAVLLHKGSALNQLHGKFFIHSFPLPSVKRADGIYSSNFC